MKIFIIGYGKMGKTIESLAVQEGHSVMAVVDSGQCWPSFTDDNRPDVAIEFTQPEVVVDNLKHCIDMGIPVVTGTTGWEAKKDEVKFYCNQKKGTVMFSSNYSIGVNVWFSALKAAAAGLALLGEYSVSMEETHHLNKIDKPSGTAITAAGILLQQIKKYNGWSLKEDKGKIHIEANRKQEVTGIHKVLFTSDMDEIELVHKAFNRDGFAKGALQAAWWISDKKGFFNFAEVFEDIFIADNK